jgi:hypothetical protein
VLAHLAGGHADRTWDKRCASSPGRPCSFSTTSACAELTSPSGPADLSC